MLELSSVQNFSKEMLITASELRKNYAVSYWDSLIVSAAINADCLHYNRGYATQTNYKQNNYCKYF